MRLTCPVLDCEWTEDVSEPDPRVLQRETLATVFGPGVMAARAESDYMERVETALTKHHADHSTADYLRTMEQQRARIVRLAADFVRADRERALWRLTATETGKVFHLPEPPGVPLDGTAAMFEWVGRLADEAMRLRRPLEPKRDPDGQWSQP